MYLFHIWKALNNLFSLLQSRANKEIMVKRTTQGKNNFKTLPSYCKLKINAQLFLTDFCFFLSLLLNITIKKKNYKGRCSPWLSVRYYLICIYFLRFNYSLCYFFPLWLKNKSSDCSVIFVSMQIRFGNSGKLLHNYLYKDVCHTFLVF